MNYGKLGLDRFRISSSMWPRENEQPETAEEIDMVLEADEIVVELASITERIGVVPGSRIRRDLKKLGTEMIKYFEQEELL